MTRDMEGMVGAHIRAISVAPAPVAMAVTAAAGVMLRTNEGVSKSGSSRNRSSSNPSLHYIYCIFFQYLKYYWEACLPYCFNWGPEKYSA